MKLKPILKLTYRRIRRRIISFKKIDLKKIEQYELVELIQNSFTIPTGTYPQTPGIRPMCRACINEDDLGNYIEPPFTSKKRIAYHPHPPKYGRCNLIDKPVFYGATSIGVAISEICNNVLNVSLKEIYITLGEWNLNQKIQVAISCHSRRAKKKSKELVEAYHAMAKLARQEKSKSEFRIWKIKNRFFSDQFAKLVLSGNEKEYLFSALYANTVLKGKSDRKIRANGIWYPSVKYRFIEHNVAYSVDLIENGILELKKVKHIKCNYRGKRKEPDFEVLKETTTIEGDKIIWP